MVQGAEQPIRVLVVGSKYPPEYAGSGVAVHGTYRRLADAGYPVEWEVITNAIEFPWNEDYEYDGISVKRISSSVFKNWDKVSVKIFSRLLFAMKSYREALATWLALFRAKPKIIHVFGMAVAPAAAIWWARFRKIPLVVELVTNQATPFQGFPGLRPKALLDMQHQTAVIAISDALGEACAEQGLRENVWVRGNSVENDRFKLEFSKKQTLRQCHTPFGKGDIVLSMVAKFMPQKNQIFLLDVMAKLPNQYKLILAGPMVTQGRLLQRDQAYVEAIRTKVMGLGLQDRVVIKTEFVDAADYMKLSDVYMMPNTNEGLGTPMLEAIACGTPVVANMEESPFRQWIEDGVNGYLCPLESDRWVGAIEKVISIGADKMEQQAKRVLARVGSDQLDLDFLNLLKTMQFATVKDRISIHDVLGMSSLVKSETGGEV